MRKINSRYFLLKTDEKVQKILDESTWDVELMILKQTIVKG